MPSDMPIRMYFGNWNKFLTAMGVPVRKPIFTAEARRKSRLTHKERRSFAWKGGKHIDKSGYVQIWMPEHENARLGGYVHEHRLVMSNIIGRPLTKKESVHHKNGCRSDNRPENLELWVSMQPSGQRVNDLVVYAKEILSIYGNIHENPELLE